MKMLKILNQRLLLEQEDPSKVSKSVDFNDTSTLLSNVISYCKGVEFLKGKPIKAMSKTKPVDSTGAALMLKFPDVYKSGKDNLAFAVGEAGGGNLILVFGMQDPNIPENALLGYNVRPGVSSDRIVGGIGKGCQYIQQVKDVGQSQLSPYDKAKLDNYMKIQGGLFVTTDPKDPLNYREYKMKDLKDADNNPLLQNPGEGIVWKKVSAGTQEMGNIANESYEYMTNQGFTLKKPPVGSTYAEMGFYLGDIAKDVRSMGIDPDLRTNQIFFPDPTYTTEYGTNLLNPDRKTCKTVISKLYNCKVGKQTDNCKTTLIQDKFIAMSCKKNNFIEGPFGKGDEFNDLLSDTVTDFGLRKISTAIGKAKYAAQTRPMESLNRKINKVLNEEHNKFSFNKQIIKFDPLLVESIADQLVLRAYFDFKKDFKKFQKINENVIGDLFTGISDKFSLGDAVTQGFKEQIAKLIIKYLGFDPKSYMSLLIINVFANLASKDYIEFLNNCEKFSAIITKSALEAWLDKAVQSMGVGADAGITSFAYSTLKNSVTEMATNTAPFKKLEGLAGKIVCTILDGVKGQIPGFG